MRLFIQIIDNIYIYTAAHACMTGRCREETPNKKKKERKKCRVQLRRETTVPSPGHNADVDL